MNWQPFDLESLRIISFAVWWGVEPGFLQRATVAPQAQTISQIEIIVIIIDESHVPIYFQANENSDLQICRLESSLV